MQSNYKHTKLISNLSQLLVIISMDISLAKWHGKVAIVTGASAGIGASISENLVKSGVHVVGLARREERLKQLESQLKNEPGKFYPIKVDLCNEHEILEAFKWIQKNVGPIHILINNAGVRKRTNLVEGRTELWKEIIDTNLLGLCIATREAIQDMRNNNIDGHIFHINSLTGHKVVYFPDSSVYPASKFAVTALTDTLRQELNAIGSKIKITDVSPARVDTEFRCMNGLNDMTGAPELKPEDVADAVLYALGTAPHVQVHEIIIRPVGEIP